MFHVGQQVVCVDDRPCRQCGTATNIKRGSVYTISAFYQAPDGAGVQLYEVAVHEPFLHDGFHASRFRPVKETDISIFTEMLTKKPEPVS